MSLVLALLALLATLLQPAPARTISVLPGQSISAAVSWARPGDVIVVSDGVYRESLQLDRSGQSGAPITIRAQSPGGVILDGGGISGSAQFIRIEGLTVRNVRNTLQNENAAVRTGSNWTLVDVTAERCTGNGFGVFGQDVVLINPVSRYNGHNGIGGARCRRVVVSGGETYRNNRGVTDPPWTKHPEARQIDGKWFVNPAWEGGGGKWAFTDGVRIENHRSYENGGPGIWFDIENRNVTITGCEVFGNVGIGNAWEGMGISIEISHGPSVVTGNWCHDNSGANIAVQESTDVLVQGNWIANGGLELRAMDRRPGLGNVRVIGNFFRNGTVYTTIGAWRDGTARDLRLVIDANTYDNPDGRLLSWGGRDYSDLPSLRRRLGLEATGKSGKVQLPTSLPATRPTVTP